MTRLLPLLLVLAACGGGGGDPEPEDTPLTVIKDVCTFDTDAQADAAEGAGLVCRIWDIGTKSEG